MQLGCMSADARDALDYSSFEHEEAQIQAVFKEAIRLKKKVKDLTSERNLYRRENEDLQVALASKEDKLFRALNKREKEVSRMRGEYEQAATLQRANLEATSDELRKQAPAILNLTAQLLALEEELRSRHVLYSKQEQESREYLRPQLEAAQTELRKERKMREDTARAGGGEHKHLKEELRKARKLAAHSTAALQEAKKNLTLLSERRAEVTTAVHDLVHENKMWKDKWAKHKLLQEQQQEQQQHRMRMPQQSDINSASRDTADMSDQRLSVSLGGSAGHLGAGDSHAVASITSFQKASEIGRAHV